MSDSDIKPIPLVLYKMLEQYEGKLGQSQNQAEARIEFACRLAEYFTERKRRK